LAAAIGYSGTLMFFVTSFAIGLTIATTAQVSRALGRGETEEAARLGGAGLILMGMVMIAITALMFMFARPLLGLLGAQGETLDIAVRFMLMVLPSMPLMAIGMSAAGLLARQGRRETVDVCDAAGRAGDGHPRPGFHFPARSAHGRRGHRHQHLASRPCWRRHLWRGQNPQADRHPVAWRCCALQPGPISPSAFLRS
jgi:hypothetical protein